ncbi:C-GCAxxG-C-C family protein [Desulfovibrio sp. 86]|uniref:C_GCAxxG_C_C family protein n=1 Tax=uncultured Desulfovibrio sp. TaxID=167968 RepID=A0A212L5E8_9BACT|nr:C-GCAxxG-C-C family protein [Desulfovibrio sp. 86]SCM72745.1 C_GCAxxG_C_C family protein [uncultured Desulfovibrio sp.]VZH33713.1 C_GCAxxG_C_C family protein [Desulfovibrio sp. 86]
MRKKMDIDAVREDFNMGIICAQQVLSHFSERFGVPEKDALRLASCFGSGMGQASTCGCVTGALMVMGLAHGVAGPRSREQKQNLYGRRDAFMAAFAAAHGSVECRGVLGHDLTDPQQLAVIKEKKLFTTVCVPLICETCTLLEEYL